MKDLTVWVRMGDSGDYEAFDTPYDAGVDIAQYTSDRKPRYTDMGIELADWTGLNYISLFWGDKDAQPVGDANLSESDRMDFEQGLLDG